MGLRLIVAPAVEPVSLDDLKRHLRIDGAAEDTVLATLIVVARAAVERFCGKALIAQTWRWSFDRVPAGGVMALPIAPVLSVAQMRVADAIGGMAVVPGANLTLDITGEPARLAVRGLLPVPGTPIGGVEVDVVAGFGATADLVPPLLAAAVRLLAAHWYAERGEPVATALPADVADLLSTYRRRRVA